MFAWNPTLAWWYREAILPFDAPHLVNMHFLVWRASGLRLTKLSGDNFNYSNDRGSAFDFGCVALPLLNVVGIDNHIVYCPPTLWLARRDAVGDD